MSERTKDIAVAAFWTFLLGLMMCGNILALNWSLKSLLPLMDQLAPIAEEIQKVRKELERCR